MTLTGILRHFKGLASLTKKYLLTHALILCMDHRTAFKVVQYSTVQYSTVQYSTVQYSTVQYSTVQYSIVQYSTMHVSAEQCSKVSDSAAEYNKCNIVQW